MPLESFALAAGQRYEALGEWEKAEDQYLVAGKAATVAIQQAALAAISRVRKNLKKQKQEDAFAAAKLLEDEERWNDAEKIYLDLLKSDSGAEKEISTALTRVRQGLRWRQWTETFDTAAAIAGRIVLLLFLLFVLLSTFSGIRRSRRSVQVMSIRASSDNGSKQIAFWLERARAELRSPAVPERLSPSLVSPAGSLPVSLRFIRMPDLPEPISEPLEFELGGIKFPLKQLTQMVGIPSVRVSGAWTVGTTIGDAYAEIECRCGTRFEPYSIVTRTIASSAGSAQDRDLQLFAYDVLIKAGIAYER